MAGNREVNYDLAEAWTIKYAKGYSYSDIAIEYKVKLFKVRWNVRAHIARIMECNDRLEELLHPKPYVPERVAKIRENPAYPEIDQAIGSTTRCDED